MNAAERFVVRVGGLRAGTLAVEGAGRHVFAYLPDCPPERFVSLTMPVRLESYAWHELHPVFQMALPEPDLIAPHAARLAREGAVRPVDLLPLGAASAPGRVQVLRADTAGPVPPPTLPGALDERWICVRSPSPAAPRALLAWCGLRVAQRAGFDVPRFELVDGGERLCVERFDGVPGARLGWEDFCALLGLAPAQRYECTCERLVDAAATFTAPVRRVAARRALFRRLALDWLLRNAEGHLRSFGLVYDSAADPGLAPLAELSTALGAADDGPALSLGGQRAWRLRKGSWRRFAAHCALADREASAIVQWLADAAQAELGALEREAALPRELLALLRAQWGAGAEDLRAGF